LSIEKILKFFKMNILKIKSICEPDPDQNTHFIADPGSAILPVSLYRYGVSSNYARTCVVCYIIQMDHPDPQQVGSGFLYLFDVIFKHNKKLPYFS